MGSSSSEKCRGECPRVEPILLRIQVDEAGEIVQGFSACLACGNDQTNPVRSLLSHWVPQALLGVVLNIKSVIC